jgi:hypothetical protein
VTSAFGGRSIPYAMALFLGFPMQCDAERLKNMRSLRAITRHGWTASNGVRCALRKVWMMVGIDAD